MSVSSPFAYTCTQNDREDGHSRDVRLWVLATPEPNRKVRHFSRLKEHRTCRPHSVHCATTSEACSLRIEQARAGLALVVSLLLSPSTSGALLSSGPLNPYPFDRLPSNLALASELVRAKFEEARRSRAEEPEASDTPKRRLWRERWRQAATNGVTKFRSRICDLTGLLCDKKGA